MTDGIGGVDRRHVFLGSAGLGALRPWLDELPRRPTSAVIVPTASKHYETAPWVERTVQALGDLAVKTDLLDLEGASPDTIAGQLQVDLVFVTGGDPLFLLEHAQQSGFSTIVPPLVRSGRLAYAGVSAGALLAGPDLMHCAVLADPGTHVPASTRGLGIAPIVTFPHANREGRKNIAARLISAFGDRFQFVPITDDQAIIICGDTWEIRASQ